MSIPVLTIDATGAHLPDYEVVRSWVIDQFKAIYGDDIYLEPDSQDGQLIAIFSQAVHDCNSMALAVYNSRGPATAQGEGLSSVVKINGITRQIATYSTVDLRVVGQVGSVINSGVASDINGNRWILPDIIIPAAGEITVTATAANKGAITAPAGTVTTIATPTLGWQTVENLAAADPGAPVETDALLRERQAISTANPALTPLEAIKGAIADLTGVTRVGGRENDTAAVDAYGLPPHSIGLVVAGGVSADIAAIIANKKTVGTATTGSTAIDILDSASIPRTIRFSRPTDVEIQYQLTIKALPGYSSARLADIKAAIVAWTNAIAIGDVVTWGRAFLPANLYGDASRGAGTYRVEALTMRRGSNAFSPLDITLGYSEAAFAQTSGITITVTT